MKNCMCRRMWSFLLVVFLLLPVALQGQTLSGNFPAETLSNRISRIAKNSGRNIAFDENKVKEIRVQALNVGGKSVEDALSGSLQSTRFTFRKKADNSFVVFEKQEETVNATKQPSKSGKGTLSGSVVDERGEPIIGATVVISGTTIGTATDVDGKYTLPHIPAGTTVIQISFMSYETLKVNDVKIVAGKTTPLSVSLKEASHQMGEVIVTANYRIASTSGMYALQKSTAAVTNGISAEQISATPDKNIGESLKRISGVTTFDNKNIVVRGIAERYNAAMLDGSVLPSTEAQSRNFSFDLIPSNMVDNVVVSKTVTPDMNANFGGGLVQVNTKDIPNANFTSITAGISYNDQTTGKDFLSRKRGKYDYLGFDDGRRKFPSGLVITEGAPDEITLAQSKKFTNDNFSVYKYTAIPSQNYQVVLGRQYNLKDSRNLFGFTGSLSYRNTQSINIIENQTRGSWAEQGDNHGKSYGFNTTWGALFNSGLDLGNHRFSLRNTYTHLYNNTFVTISGWSTNREPSEYEPIPTRIEESDDPAYTDLLQNKLSGQHQLGIFKAEWEIARTGVSRKEKDMGIADKSPREVGASALYVYSNVNANGFPMSRHNYENSESHYSWNASVSMPLDLGAIHNSFKLGYFGLSKHGEFDWTIAGLVGDIGFRTISEALDPDNMSMDGIHYEIDGYSLDTYKGKSQTHAGYLMLDHRLSDKLRLVWGVRGEYYKYTELRNNPSAASKTGFFSIKPNKRWQWMPSVNLTYSPLSTLNIRTAYSSSVVRPELMDNTQFWRYNPYLGSMVGSQGLYSTRIDSYDLRTEWFPGAGEIISAGVFYKKFDKPAELSKDLNSTSISYTLRSSHWAKVYGVEFEFRKNFGFIADNRILKDLTAYGNLTLQTSEVKAYYLISDPENPNGPNLEVAVNQTRPMYGQAPWLLNLGLQYTGERLGLNLAYNKSSHKTYTISRLLSNIEYEAPREQLDAQISYCFFNKLLEVKLSASNLLNQASMFYQNDMSYESNPDYVPNVNDYSEAIRLKEGFSEKYDDGDQILFKQRYGRTFSISLTYNFK